MTWAQVEDQVSSLFHVALSSCEPIRFRPTSASASGLRRICGSSHQCFVEAVYNARGRVVVMLSRRSDGRCWVFPSLRIARAHIPRIQCALPAFF